MMIRSAGVILLLGSILVTVACEPPQPDGTLSPHQQVHFTLGVEQDGRRIPVRDNQVILAKKPFRFVFYFEELGAMLVQASFQSRFVEMAETGVPLNQMLKPDAAIVEDLFNPQGLLYVHERGLYHNWLYLGPQTHRFDASDGVVDIPDGGYLCRRTVRNLVVDEKSIPVENSPRDTIYCVFIQTERTPGTRSRVERQRDWLEIRFAETTQP